MYHTCVTVCVITHTHTALSRAYLIGGLHFLGWQGRERRGCISPYDDTPGKFQNSTSDLRFFHGGAECLVVVLHPTKFLATRGAGRLGDLILMLENLKVKFSWHGIFNKNDTTFKYIIYLPAYLLYCNMFTSWPVYAMYSGTIFLRCRRFVDVAAASEHEAHVEPTAAPWDKW